MSDKSPIQNQTQIENVEVEKMENIAQETINQRTVTKIEDLARKMGGKVLEIVEGETWNYAIIETSKALVLVKYSPRSKAYLFTKGLIAIGISDLLKVLNALNRHGKAYVQEYLRQLAQKYGIEINFK